MTLRRPNIQLLVAAVLCIAATALYASDRHNSFYTRAGNTGDVQNAAEPKKANVADADSTRFPVRPTTAQDESGVRHSADLRDPENLQTGVFFDEKSGTYRFGTKLGDNFLESPFYMTPAEYQQWATKRSMRGFFKKKNAEAYSQAGKDKFDFTDMHFDLGPASKIFGPGGVRIKTQGSAELKIGGNLRFVDNPSLSERNRRVFGFDFDEKVNLNVSGKVGDKMGMDFNYNSDATFAFDTQKLKLRYEGKEDEMVRLIEAGNVSMQTSNSLIRGASSLFGFHTQLQFGKLKLSAILAQKKSSTSSVSSSGGVQLTSYEFSADAYDENRHFFLAQFFRDNYDASMAQLPNILSGISVNRVEVWVTNKTGQTTNTRNIVAFTDMGEYSHISNKMWKTTGSENPSNESNSLYSAIVGMPAARDISIVTPTLDGAGLVGGTDYEKLESARLLNNSEYRLNSALGYISLKTALQTDQVLAVAFEYTYRGQTYQVGEFSTDQKDNSSALYVKSLKNTANTPSQGNWDLMMKNVYSLGASSVQQEKFRLDVKILSDTSGVYLSYLPEPGLKEQKLIQLLGLDRLDNNNKHNPNAYFDFVPGYTIDQQEGRVYFTTVEPFGSYLKKVVGNPDIAERYMFQELYDSTRTIARQIAEKNKYIISGQYKASREDEISLGSYNVPRGSVVVTAGGVKLTEGSDYTVDYSGGVVRILNKSLLDAGTAINVSLESNTEYGMQRKTLLGLNWEYDFSKNIVLGGTFLHLREKPLTTKVSMGGEALNNTIWGLNFAYKKESQWLTDMLDRLPLVTATEPSSINFSAEFAQLMAGKNRGTQGNASYLDDFETASSDYDISNPKEWTLSSVPSMFPESQLSNDPRYGYNRALLAWYYIDPLFTRRNSSLTPGHIKGDLAQLSDDDVREVYKLELFPNRQINYRESATLDVLNLAYYPNERGPYNLDPELDINGHLSQPAKRWGGMMRRLDGALTDFEANNIEYVEFWMMDPFVKAKREGRTFSGDFYINLGEISEDVLKDGKKFYESGMPTDGNSSLYTETVWGRVPNQNTVTYAFNTSSGSRGRQDVGYNGLTSEEERDFGIYRDYLAQVQGRVRQEVYDSLLLSPSGDRYHYFRGSDFDRERKSIVERYKRINNPNGNSPDSDNSPESYSTAYKTTPDVEDINQDYTLNEYEKYLQYHIRISPEDMQVGRNYIVDSRVTTPVRRDGSKPEVTWYLFRIPVESYEKNVGGLSDLTSMRFMRMYLTGFEEPVILRLATLNLVRGEWRPYEQPLYAGRSADLSGTLEPASVGFEENNDKLPVNYVIPPGITRVIDPGMDQLLENNEEALSITVKNLSSGEARAVYKNTNLDLRRYRHIQMFAHANSLEGLEAVEDGQTSIFVRLGSDYKSNFYEYEIPLAVTPPGKYPNSTSGALQVWPESNMLDIDLSLLTTVKKNRNRAKSLGAASYGQLYSEYDPNRQANKVSVMGNPSLGEIHTIMIGVRNNSRRVQNVEVWANELRLQDFANNGGIGAQASLNLKLSDLATIDVTGHMETEGFGGLEEGVTQRRDDNLYQYSLTTNVQLGKLLPEKVKLNAPLYFSYSKERVVPKYNPLDTDMSMDEALDGLTTQQEKDSLQSITDRVVVSKNLSLTGVRFNIKTSKRTALPFDPANFTFGYAHSSRHTSGETTVWEKDQNWKWSFNYSYSPNIPTFEPFKKLKGKSQWLKFPKELGINFLPQSVTFNSDITRQYYELQERDMENLDNKSLPLTWNSDFLWNRAFSIRWDLTKNIHASFSSGTNAEVEQPYTAVNKDLYPDQYTAWKDSIWQSIRHLGTPLSYAQNFEASWKVPINKIPLFDWLTTDVTYRSTYNWTRGAELENGTSMGHTISNSRDVSGNVRLNMETLYNHVPFLKEANKKFSSGGGRSSSKNKKNDKDKEKKNFEKEIQLKADTTIVVQHNQRTKKFQLTAIRPDGTRMRLRYKVLDNNRIEILTQDTARVKVTIRPKRVREEQPLYKFAQYGARFLMMLRNVSVTYSNKYNMNIPGFLPRIGDIFGQQSAAGLAPGLDFAFGTVDEGYIERAAERGWLMRADSVITPATTNLSENLQLRATLEPFRDFKIDVTASRTRTDAKSIQYMFGGMPTTCTGTFNQTTISIGSAFESIGSADRGYPSSSFLRFVNSLDAYQARVEAQYADAAAKGIYDPAVSHVNRYSADVMIPAFLSAYTVGGKRSLDIFPTIARMLPNWSVTYGGLSRLNAMKSIFKSFNLNHAYKSVFSIGSYNTFTTWQEYMGGLGFIRDVQTGQPTPSSMYDVSTVSINESFSPLFGIDMTFHNNLTAKIEYRRTRVLTLSMTNQQINETRSNDFVIGLGYKIPDFKFAQPKKTVRERKVRTRTRGRERDEDDNSNQRTTSSQRSGSSSFAHALNLRLDFSIRNQAALNRDIATMLTQATSGNKALQLSFSADYAVSKLLTLTAYYDRQMNTPLMTSSSYPTTTQDFGISFKFSLNH